MNNEQFRKLVQDTPARESHASPTNAASAFGAKKSSLLGGMTPRPGKGSSSSNNDFARQIRERHASLQPTKKFKTYAPKGSKFAAGYVDRAKARQEAQDAEDDKEQRVKALEEQAKLGQLPFETFEALRDQITGGDFASAHLVKGLDRKLLERVRRGEDVLGTGGSKAEAEEEEASVDVDDELDKLEEREVETVKREKADKKGSMAPPPVAGVKRTRDEIMAELKAQRKAAAEAKAAAAPALDSRWKRVGEQAKPKIEIDHKGREVLITVGEDGVAKKKVRKLADGAVEGKAAVNIPDSTKVVLGADVAVPEQPKPTLPDEDEDDDIFENVGTEYNPLGDLQDDDDDSDDSDDGNGTAKPAKEKLSATSSTDKSDAASKPPSETPVDMPKRNYFNEKPAASEDKPADRFKGIENILKKAARLGAASNEDGDDNNDAEDKATRDARLAKRAKMLAQEDRDMDDMDMGFGSSRYEDEQEGGEEKRVKLSEWKGGAAGGDDGWEEDKKSRGDKPKRKPKKRKGDVNNAADIFRVIEGRKAGNK